MNNLEDLLLELQEEKIDKVYDFVMDNLNIILEETIDLEDIFKNWDIKVTYPNFDKGEYFEPIIEVEDTDLATFLVGTSSDFENIILDQFFEWKGYITEYLSQQLNDIKIEAESIIREKINKHYIK